MTHQRFFAVALLVAVFLALLVGGASGHPRTYSCRDCQLDDFGFRHHFHHRPAEAVPGRVGQDALGAVQEVVGLLLADPETDWSEISIARLRRHLVDLNELMLHAEATERAIAGGLEVVVRGSGPTLAALRRLVPAHADRMTGFRGWTITSRDDGESVRLTLVSGDPSEVEVLRALGFFGFMASGVYHPHELLAVARGRGGHWPDPAGD